jgi:hypothetical protein
VDWGASNTIPLSRTANEDPFMYSQKWNCAASFPVSTFMFVWAIYILYSHDRSNYFAAAKQAEYINRSQEHECGNWELGLTVSFLGIFVSNFRYSVFAVRGNLKVRNFMKTKESCRKPIFLHLALSTHVIFAENYNTWYYILLWLLSEGYVLYSVQFTLYRTL